MTANETPDASQGGHLQWCTDHGHDAQESPCYGPTVTVADSDLTLRLTTSDDVANGVVVLYADGHSVELALDDVAELGGALLTIAASARLVGGAQ